jgi:hypothetical protein
VAVPEDPSGSCRAGSVYLRKTRRTPSDGPVVRYVQLATTTAIPTRGNPTLYSFGGVGQIDPAALEWSVGSVFRFFDQEPSIETSGEVEPVDGRGLGGAWVLDQLWGQPGIGKAFIKLARGRRPSAGRASGEAGVVLVGGPTGVGAVLEVGSDPVGLRGGREGRIVGHVSCAGSRCC